VLGLLCPRSPSPARRCIDLGHVGVYRALAAGAGVAGNGEDTDLSAALRAGTCRRSPRSPPSYRPHGATR
jgi:hypothetical protein